MTNGRTIVVVEELDVLKSGQRNIEDRVQIDQIDILS